jgi:ATP-dependent helicase/nuclease subunit B
VRALDRALRQPGVLPGWDGITAFLVVQKEPPALIDWWRNVADEMRPVADAFVGKLAKPAALIDALRSGLTQLAGDAVWQGPAGRTLADVMTRWAAFAPDGPLLVDPEHFPAMVYDLLGATPVRKPFGDHPRLFIWGLLEARLQRADVMILGGLNEGSWPQAPSADPWLAPGIRRALGLAGPDRRLGLSAHDFAGALASSEVRLTRANRSGSDPAVASRFWLRLMAMTGGVGAGGLPDYPGLARALDDAPRVDPAERPVVHVPRAQRPTAISVTAVDLLQKDPYSYYARHILRLDRLDPIDGRASPAWRGTRVHKLLEEWVRDDDCDPAALEVQLVALAADPALDPVSRALWLPRIIPALRWAAERIIAGRAEGRVPIGFEAGGTLSLAGVELTGKADRIDQMPDGSLAIVDYKTGAAPSAAAVLRGEDRQLGLLGAMAAAGRLDKVAAGEPSEFEYWQLKPNRSKGEAAEVKRAYDARSKDPDKGAGNVVVHAVNGFTDLAARYLTGDAPFAPETTRAAFKNRDAHQLMRRDEWFGREPEEGGDG